MITLTNKIWEKHKERSKVALPFPLGEGGKRDITLIQWHRFHNNERFIFKVDKNNHHTNTLKSFIQLIILLVTLLLLITCSPKKEGIWAEQLRCNYKENPTGVGKKTSFSWILQSHERNQKQTAYQLLVAKDVQSLNPDNKNVWNSGKVQSEQSLHLILKELDMEAGQRYFWKVRVWDKNNIASPWSESSGFVTGIFNEKDWSDAQWISMETMHDSAMLVPGIPTWGRNTKNVALRRPIVPLFRKEFENNQKVESAFLFISGLGHYKAYLNGEQISHDFLSPGWSDYQETCLYNTYDVTRMLQKGNNALGIIVGNGFHNVNNERYRKLLITYGMPKLIAKLQVNYSDGTTQSIVSNQDWKTTHSPITYSSIYGGETYDARMEQTGWNKADFDDAHWQPVLLAQKPGGTLHPENIHPVQTMETFKPEKIIQTGTDSFMIDFGQNASGIIQIQVRGQKGDTVRIVPSELINEDYSANQRATGRPHYYEYILKGDGIETWQPMFSYYGFRFAQVYGASPAQYHSNNDSPELLEITMLHTRNSAPSTGSFWCSNPLFNQIDSLIRYGIKSNLQSVMTDCPHREKLGWLEQTYLMGHSVQHNFELYHMYQKLVRDMMDSQRENGLVGSIAPEYVVFGDAFTDSPEWGSALIMLPWLMYKWYGDTSLMQEAWPAMKRYMDYLDSQTNDHILSYGLGDWYDLGPERPGFSQLSPIATTATGIYYLDYKVMAKMARLLKNTSQVKEFEEKASSIRNAYNQLLFHENEKIYASGSQTAMAIPLSTGIVEDKYRSEVLQNLVDSILANDKKITAGDIGFHYLIDALTEGGHSQLIYEMNNRRDVPGYGYQIEQGATALTESWQALPSVSNNHMMLGHLEEWLYKGLGGIRQEKNSVAYKNVIIKPALVNGLNHVKTTYQSPYGNIKSEWKKSPEETLFNISIPVNTEAKVYLPTNRMKDILESNEPLQNKPEITFIKNAPPFTIIKIGSGDYVFTLKNSENE